MTLDTPVPVALVHGWGGSFEATWQRSGFTALMEDGGKPVLGVDLLGHGDAPKPHDPDEYADMTTRIVDALPDEPVDAIGFSLGALTLLRLAVREPHRFNRLVLAGIGRNVFERDTSGTDAIVSGLEQTMAGGDLGDLTLPVRLFVQYAQQPGNDLAALTAVMKRTGTVPLTPVDLSVVTCPVLVVVGTDDFVHPADELARAFPDGRCVELAGVDHFATPESFGFFDAALEFVDAI
ncbi:MAG: alpha/beta fold hydrolase [Acidimicrobiia bacterium]|nr:alpha/beta fold hydrolase [Acidimicrobiia bacterium]